MESNVSETRTGGWFSRRPQRGGQTIAVSSGCGLPFKSISGLQSTRDVYEVTEVDLPVRQCAFLEL